MPVVTPSASEQLLLPIQTIIYPGWTGDVLKGGDLALLKLGKPSNHAPIALPSGQYPMSVSDPLMVLGWGQNLEGDMPVEMHMGANMQVIPNEICSSGSVWGDVISENMICAFALNFEGDTCEGELLASPLDQSAIVTWGRIFLSTPEP